LRLALDEIANYRLALTFAFVDPDGVEARWELLEALAQYRGRQRTSAAHGPILSGVGSSEFRPSECSPTAS
jgi:hypothetical protein